MKRFLILVAALFAVENAAAQATKPIRELAETIAARAMGETPYSFTDGAGKTYTSLRGVPLDMTMKVTSQYNDWHYTNGVYQIALLELAELTGDRKYVDYVERNMRFVFEPDNLNYFRRQFEQKFAEGGWPNIRNLSWHMIFRNKRLDDNGPMAASLVDLQALRPQDAFRGYYDSAAEHLRHAEPRLSDGTIARLWPHENTIWADDLFMALSLMSRLGERTGDVKWFDDAAGQVLRYHDYLWDADMEIYWHCLNVDVMEHGVAHWSRANGWMLMAKADLLSRLPENHPKRDSLIANYNAQVMGILQYQGVNGLWHQVLDKVDSYEEITGTAMFVFGIARGVREGWIHPDYIYAAEQGLRGMRKFMSDSGDVNQICIGTGIMPSLAFYYNRPTQSNAPMGEGPVLRALIEMAKAKPYWEIKAEQQYDKIQVKH